MTLAKNTQNKPNRFPKNLFDYISSLPPNDDFLPLIRENSENIRSLITRESPPSEINDALFIIELNNFKRCLIKITELLDEIRSEEKKIHLALNKSEEALDAIDSKKLIRRIENFYAWASDYDENFVIRNWFPIVNGRPFRLNMLWTLDSPFRCDEATSNADNAYKAQRVFAHYDDYFRNFINTLYGDGEDGNKFLGKSLSEVVCEYKWLKSTSEEIEKYTQTKEVQAAYKKIELNNEEISAIMKKYPATVYAAIIQILNFFRKDSSSISAPA